MSMLIPAESFMSMIRSVFICNLKHMKAMYTVKVKKNTLSVNEPRLAPWYLLHVTEAKHDISSHPCGPWGEFLSHDPGAVVGILGNRKTQELRVRENNRHPCFLCYKYTHFPVWLCVYEVNGARRKRYRSL